MTLVDRYLQRIGVSRRGGHDLSFLTELQQAHLTAVPFENLHVFHRIEVSTDTEWSVAKVVEQGRGGWCFENNGAFAWLLDQLGFSVRRLGAAVLLDGPNSVIDHCTLEVALDQPYLVDVGFGDSFSTPLALNQVRPQDGGTGTYGFMPSAQGTTLVEYVDSLPKPLFRFRRVAHEMADFDPASQRLQANESGHWRRWPFATRLLDGGPDRVTLRADCLKLRRAGVITEQPVAAEDWDNLLWEWFEMRKP